MKKTTIDLGDCSCANSRLEDARAAKRARIACVLATFFAGCDTPPADLSAEPPGVTEVAPSDTGAVATTATPDHSAPPAASSAAATASASVMPKASPKKVAPKVVVAPKQVEKVGAKPKPSATPKAKDKAGASGGCGAGKCGAGKCGGGK